MNNGATLIGRKTEKNNNNCKPCSVNNYGKRKMKFDYLEIINAIFSKTIKRRSWYKIKQNNNFKLCHRTLEDIVQTFTNECDDELKGLYRNHKKKLTDDQIAWKEYLLKTEYSFFLTIKLPNTTQDGYIRTRNRTESVAMYKKLVTELEKYFTNKKHFERNPFLFTGVLEKGKSGFWHIHLAIPRCNDDLYIGVRLCWSIAQLINKHKFYKTVIDLRTVYDQEGLCAYMVKELKTPPNSEKDEGTGIFYTKTWFTGIKKDHHIIRNLSRPCKRFIRASLKLMKDLTFKILKPAQYIKKKLFQKRFNRCGSKINSSANFDSS